MGLLGNILKKSEKPPVSSSDLMQNNPYRNQDYYTSPWQGFLSALGFRNQSDAWRENMSVQAAEYDAQMAMKKYDEEYNLPINQVARMRAAGLNPDLDGGNGISPGEAAQVGDDPSTPMQATSDFDQIMPVVNGVLSSFSTALGMVSTLQGVRGNHLSNIFSSIQNEKEFSDFASGLSGVLLPPSPSPDGVLNFDWKSAAINNAEKFAGAQLPKHLRKKFVDFQTQYWNSAIGEGESYEDFRKRVNSRKGWASDFSTFYTELGDSVLLDITEPIASMFEKIYQQNQKTQLKEGEASEEGAKTEIAYQHSLDGTDMALAQNAANANAKESQSSLSLVNSTIHDIIGRLKKTSEKGGLEGALASVAMALISGLYLYSNSNIHPNVSRSESQSHGNWQTDHGYGRNDGGSRSWHLGF